ncbi:DKNYY domain-containing protein [Capnocytophaga gingivalis]
MKYVLYGILVLTIMQYSSAQYRKIQLTDAKKVEHLKLESLWARCKYNEGFIYNKDYMIYQACYTAVTFYPDRKTFQIKDKDYGFAVDKNGVYYQGQFVKVDTTGFEVLARRKVKRKIGYKDIDSYYWRTNGGVFFGTERLSVSDPQTFEALTYCYFRDKNHVYYYDQIIEGVDPNLVNKQFTNEEFLNDGKNVYYKGKRLYYKGEAVEQMSYWIFKTSKYVLGYNDREGDEKHSFLIELYSEPFDIPTLRALNNSYLIDKNHLYYMSVHYPIWDNGFRLFVPKEELSSIRAFTEFVVVGSTVYHKRKPEKRYDAATFGIIPEHHYYQYDKRGIYNWDKKLPFRYTKRPEYGKNLFFIDEKDLFIYENQAYYYNYDNSIYAKNLTSQQIEILKQGKTSLKDLLSPHKEPPQKKEKYYYNLYKMDGHIYIGEKLQKDVDAATFEYITDYFYKDKNHVYYYDRFSEEEAHFLMVEGYDVATLKGDSNRFMMDKDYYYYGTTRLFENRNVEVLAIYTGSRLEQAPMTDYCLFKNDQGYWFAKLGDGDAICFLGKKLKMNELEND